MLSDQLRRVGPVRGIAVVVVGAAVALPVTKPVFDDALEDDAPVPPPAATAGPRALPPSASTPAVATSADREAERAAREEAARRTESRRRASAIRRSGALVVTGFSGTTLPPATARQLRSGALGGVILMGRNITDAGQVRRLTDAVHAAAEAGGRPTPVIAVDQEGGEVRRLRFAAPERSARRIGARDAYAEGQRTGGELFRVGINVDLAPVADSGPKSSFLRERTFADAPATTAVAACAFAAGLLSTGVRPTLKHFPGLGRAGATSTDAADVTVSVATAVLRADLAPYTRCAGEPRTLVMPSSARYPGLTGREPAVLSSRTYRLLRETTGNPRPVTITDALDAGALRGRPDAAWKAVRAGATFVLTTLPGDAARLREQLADAIRRGRLRPSHVNRSSTRARAFRERL